MLIMKKRGHTLEGELRAAIGTSAWHADAPAYGTHHDDGSSSALVKQRQHRTRDFDRAKHVGLILSLEDRLAFIYQYDGREKSYVNRFRLIARPKNSLYDIIGYTLPNIL